MNGAQSLVQTLVNGGVELCFTNPGTSEMHMVSALNEVAGIKPVLCLYEGVCTGAADGYARMTRTPAATLLHLGPGLANGLGNLHNAKRANSPVINIVGDHATYHRAYDTPLTSDIVSMAKPVSDWVFSSDNAATLAHDCRQTITAAMVPPGHVATLIVPADCSWKEANGPVDSSAPPKAKAFHPDAATRAGAALRSGKPSAILASGRALTEQGLDALGRIARAAGVQVFCDTFFARLPRGAGRFPVRRIPYFHEGVQKRLSGLSHLILVASKPPVSFFAYPDKTSWLTPEGCDIITLVHPEEDVIGAMQALADELGAGNKPCIVQASKRPETPAGELNADKVGAVIGALLPEGAVVSDESVTSGAAAYALTAGAPPHDWLCLTGGSMGQGLPVATGAAFACPDRKVVCLQGDGGAMYTLQSLWTQAREGLDVTTVVFSNRKYLILQTELRRLGLENTGHDALDTFDLSNPDLDWIKLANGLGVDAHKAHDVQAFSKQFRDAMAEPGPHLIEAVI